MAIETSIELSKREIISTFSQLILSIMKIWGQGLIGWEKALELEPSNLIICLILHNFILSKEFWRSSKKLWEKFWLHRITRITNSKFCSPVSSSIRQELKRVNELEKVKINLQPTPEVSQEAI